MRLRDCWQTNHINIGCLNMLDLLKIVDELKSKKIGFVSLKENAVNSVNVKARRSHSTNVSKSTKDN